MNVVLVSKDANIGGAAKACLRLFQALSKRKNVDCSLVVQQDERKYTEILPALRFRLKKKIDFIKLAIEKLFFLYYEKSPSVRWNFSTAITGECIYNKRELRNSDIIHLHWFNQGYLSLRGLKRILHLKKPVVWTLHDMWAFTGGCHYTNNCRKFESGCGQCPLLRNPSVNDLSHKIFTLKKNIYDPKTLTIVTCSSWLAGEAAKSAMLKDFTIVTIPNPIDTNLFRPINVTEAKLRLGLDYNKKVILFGAAKINDTRKGFIYLLEALEILSRKSSEFAHCCTLLVFGKSEVDIRFPIPSKVLSFMSDETKLVDIYNAADVFVLPSLQDNLPNTVMEALSCGTPVVAFRTGGIPEMIDHKLNGYLADFKSAEDLANGIFNILFECDMEETRRNARQKVINNYSYPVVAEKFENLYRSLLNNSL